MSLEGKIAVVTGGSRGIGRAVCLELARQGAAVVFSYAGNTAAARETEAACAAQGRPARGVRADVTDAAAVKALLDGVVKEFGRIDILVNVAGVQITKLLADTTKADYDKMMDINLGGTFLTMHEILPIMKKQGSGAIVNCASELAFVGYHELAVIPYGVRVNCVCPGATDTPIFWEGETDPAKRQKLLDQVKIEKPIGRLITTDEVANGIIFLASDDASGVVGTQLIIDGGFTAQ